MARLRLGYSVEVTRYRGDYGADLVVRKGGQKTAVQAKRWKKRVGLKAVQEAVAAKAMYGCDHALVVANREFTQQARRLALSRRQRIAQREGCGAESGFFVVDIDGVRHFVVGIECGAAMAVGV